MYKNISIYIYTYLFVILYIFIGVPPVFASNDFSIGIYPPITIIRMDTPTIAFTTLVVQNRTEHPIPLKIVLKPFTAANSANGDIVLLNSPPSFWKDKHFLENIRISINGKQTNNFILNPSQTQTVSISFDIPKHDTDSDYYFCLLFISNYTDPTDAKRSETNLIGGIGTNILVSIGKPEKPSGNIIDFSTRYLWNEGPIYFHVNIANKSPHVITPKGRILITNMFGQIVGKLDLSPVNILALSNRYMPNSLELAPLAGDKSGMINLQTPSVIWNEGFILGFYTASLQITLSSLGPTYTRTIYFIGFPVRLIIGLLGAILLLLFIRSRIKRQA